MKVLVRRREQKAKGFPNSQPDSKDLLARFPVELRMKIFEATLASHVQLESCFTFGQTVSGAPLFWRPNDKDASRRSFLELPHFDILRTFQEYRRETLLLPYQVTLFDLGDIRNAMIYLKSLTVQELASVRSIRIECNTLSQHISGRCDWEYPKSWSIFCQFASNVLVNLRELRVDLTGWVFSDYDDEDIMDLRDTLNPKNAWIQEFLLLRRLPLTTVEILPEKNEHANPDQEAEGLRVGFADMLKKKLLRPGIVLIHKTRLRYGSLISCFLSYY